MIPFGQGIPSFAAAVKEVQAAGEKLGWNVRVVDGKFSPNAWLAGIRDAINAKADGIITFGPDCPPIKAALQDAKKANIPVINVEGHDCDTLEPGAEPEFAHTVGYSEGTLQDWLKAMARLQADWAIAHTNGKAKVLDVFETDAHTFKVMNDEFRKQLGKCPGCEIVDQRRDDGRRLRAEAPAEGPAGAAPASGGQRRLAGRHGDAAAGRGRRRPSAGRRTSRSRSAGSARTTRRRTSRTRSWGSASTIRRSGRRTRRSMPSPTSSRARQPNQNSGLGIRVVDAEHNQDYVPYQAPIDFKAAYEKAWGVG